MSQELQATLITNAVTVVLVLLTAWRSARKSRTDADATMKLILHRIEKMEEKFSRFGEIFDRLTRLEARFDAQERNDRK